VNIPHPFRQAGVLLAQNGFVPVLEELSVSAVTVIVCYGVSRQESSRDRGNGSKTGS